MLDAKTHNDSDDISWPARTKRGKRPGWGSHDAAPHAGFHEPPCAALCLAKPQPGAGAPPCSSSRGPYGAPASRGQRPSPPPLPSPRRRAAAPAVGRCWPHGSRHYRRRRCRRRRRIAPFSTPLFFSSPAALQHSRYKRRSRYTMPRACWARTPARPPGATAARGYARRVLGRAQVWLWRKRGLVDAEPRRSVGSCCRRATGGAASTYTRHAAAVATLAAVTVPPAFWCQTPPRRRRRRRRDAAGDDAANVTFLIDRRPDVGAARRCDGARSRGPRRRAGGRTGALGGRRATGHDTFDYVEETNGC